MSTLRPFNRILPLIFGAVLIAPHLPAQQPSQTTAAAPLPIFDVVSIRENKSGSGIMMVRPTDTGFSATNTTLSTLVANAFDIRSDLISGLPSWADSARFDVNAKVTDPNINVMKDLTGDQRRAMLQAVLVDRFHIRTHIQTKTLPVYDLIVAKNGPKLKQSAPATPQNADETPSNRKRGSITVNNLAGNNSGMTAVAMPVSMLAANLAYQVERTVIDKTGLTGIYDVSLKWHSSNDLTDDGSHTQFPDLFTALQEQLGLKLESSKGPVQTLVIDHVEMPTAN
ncbi:MAG TPA: TIGR03435 family protein [Acidobacteriaceae bacterium]|nr:TIGR03435 family protein [Acidobacteriaceae bacterium]